MIVGERLRAVRESKKLSQGHIEKHTGRMNGVIGGWPARAGAKKPVNGMVRRRSLEVVECGGEEASHETTRARH